MGKEFISASPLAPDDHLTNGAVLASLGGRNLLFRESEQAIYEVGDNIPDEWFAPQDATFQRPIAASLPLRNIASGLISFDLEVGGVAVRLLLAPVLHPLAEEAFGYLEAVGLQPTLQLSAELNGDDIIITSAAERRSCRRDEFIPLLKALLIEDILRFASYSVALHTAALIVPGSDELVLLAGSPGAGKSTLALALAQSGFVLAADDVTLLQEKEGRAVGLGFPFTVKASAWDLVTRHWPQLPVERDHVRPDGRAVRYLRASDVGPPTPRRIACVALLDRHGDSGVEICAIDPVTALAALIAEAASPDDRLSSAGFLSLAAMLQRARSIRLAYSDARETSEALAHYLS